MPEQAAIGGVDDAREPAEVIGRSVDVMFFLVWCHHFCQLRCVRRIHRGCTGVDARVSTLIDSVSLIVFPGPGCSTEPGVESLNRESFHPVSIGGVPPLTPAPCRSAFFPVEPC